MESDAGAEKYHRYHEPDPEMHEMGYGGYGTPEKPIYATVCNGVQLRETPGGW